MQYDDVQYDDVQNYDVQNERVVRRRLRLLQVVPRVFRNGLELIAQEQRKRVTDTFDSTEFCASQGVERLSESMYY